MSLRPDPKRYEELERSRAGWSQYSLEEACAQARATEFRFTPRMLLRHTLLVGATGSGKTNHALHIIKEALAPGDASTSCLIIDVKKEYRRLDRILKGPVRVLAVGDEPPLKFNPLAPPDGVPADLWDRAFTDVFTRAYGLSEPSRRILHDSLAELRKGAKEQPTQRELEEQVAKFRPGARRSRTARGRWSRGSTL